jgi:hypothetical protein
MFCPTCGKDNAHERKYCASCGTNLEAITRALSVNEEGIFSKVDTSLDQLIARYAEHVFKDAPMKALDRRISNSWLLLGEGALTSLFDLALFTIMTVVLPIKLLILLVYTPIRLLSERSKEHRSAPSISAGQEAPELLAPLPQQWLQSPVASIAEHTTVNLRPQGIPKQDQL